MNRAALAAELWGRLQRPFAEVGITNSDTTGNLKEPVDSTLSALGVAYGDLATGTVAAGSEAAAIALATYYGYVAVVGAFTDKDVQVDAPTIRISKSNQGNRYETALARAKADAAAWLPDDGAAFAVGVISLDFIEPISEVWT